MSLPEFNAAMTNALHEAKKLIEESYKTKQKLTEFERFQRENITLSEENAALKKELDDFKNTIAFPKDRLAEISEEQRLAIEKELDAWNSKIYWSEDRELDNSKCTGADYYKRERERIQVEQNERYAFIQKLMTILRG